MNLEAMSLPDLEGLSARIGVLVRDGKALEGAGLAPRFDMRQGRPVVIHTGWTMFPAESPASGSGLSGETGFPAPLPLAAPQPATLYVDDANQPAPAEPEANANSPVAQDAGHQDPDVPAGEATGVAPPPAAPVVRDDDEQHVDALDRAEAWLRTVKRDAVWTLQTDHDVMHLSVLGWPAGDIAQECSVPVHKVKPRFELLTNNRTLPRATVLDALARMLAGA
jgi:hypothetical protein